MKRLLPLLLPALALSMLAGCAIAPGYSYNGAGRGGYYYGEDAYGGASTVIYNDGGYGGYYDPWGYGGYYGRGVGTTIYYYDAGGHRHYRGHRGHDGRGHSSRGHGSYHRDGQGSRPHYTPRPRHATSRSRPSNHARPSYSQPTHRGRAEPARRSRKH